MRKNKRLKTPISTTKGSKTASRKRWEKRAIEYLDTAGLSLSAKHRSKLLKRVRGATSPLIEAKAVVRQEKLRALNMDFSGRGRKIDPSDVQELRVKILKRDLILDEFQIKALTDLDRRVTRKSIGKKKFENEAADLLHMPSSLPLRFRQEEKEYHQSH